MNEDSQTPQPRQAPPPLTGWTLALFALDLLTRDYGPAILGWAERIPHRLRRQVLIWLAPLEALVRRLLLRDALSLGRIERKARAGYGLSGAGAFSGRPGLRILVRARRVRAPYRLRGTIRRWRPHQAGAHWHSDPPELAAMLLPAPPAAPRVSAARRGRGRTPSPDLSLRFEALMRAIGDRAAKTRRLARALFAPGGLRRAARFLARRVRIISFVNPWTDEYDKAGLDCAAALGAARAADTS